MSIPEQSLQNLASLERDYQADAQRFSQENIGCTL